MNFEKANQLINAIGAVSIMTLPEREYLFKIASEVGKKGWLVVEVGCSHGGTTILLALAAGHCIAIDNGIGGQIPTFTSNVAKSGVDERIKFIEQDSTIAANLFPDEHFGMVIIDADHEGNRPYLDLIAWSPKVRPGGYLLIDDVACNFPDVSKAVLKFLCEVHDYEYQIAFDHPEWQRTVKLLSLMKMVVLKDEDLGIENK